MDGAEPCKLIEVGVKQGESIQCSAVHCEVFYNFERALYFTVIILGRRSQRTCNVLSRSPMIVPRGLKPNTSAVFERETNREKTVVARLREVALKEQVRIKTAQKSAAGDSGEGEEGAPTTMVSSESQPPQ